MHAFIAPGSRSCNLHRVPLNSARSAGRRRSQSSNSSRLPWKSEKGDEDGTQTNATSTQIRHRQVELRDELGNQQNAHKLTQRTQLLRPNVLRLVSGEFFDTALMKSGQISGRNLKVQGWTAVGRVQGHQHQTQPEAREHCCGQTVHHVSHICLERSASYAELT